MKIFVDCGAYDGDTVRLFSDKANKFADDWDKIYVFEPNPLFEDKLKAMDVIFSNNVVWKYNGTVDFSVDLTYTPLGSTIMQSKRTYKEGKIISRKCFDFSEWIKQFKDDYLVVKMDIEGAEFEVLDKLLKDGTHKLIKKLYVEMHPNKVREYTTTHSNTLLARLRKDIYVEEWH